MSIAMAVSDVLGRVRLRSAPLPVRRRDRPVVFLDDYLDKASNEPWSWGGVGGQDCCFFAGDWIRNATGCDPLTRYRGRYDSALGAARLLKRRGGLVQAVEVEMTRCGFARADDPEHGDIGIVEMPFGDFGAEMRGAAVIRNGPWWIGRTLDGFAGIQSEALATWRIL